MQWKKLALGLAGAGVLAVGSLVAYAATTADARLQYPSTTQPSLRASTDPAVIERGRYLVHGPAHCAQCHSTDDRRHPEKVASTPLKGGLAFAMGPLGTRYARNLTPDRETGIGALTDAQIARALRTGVTHDGELSFFMRFAAADLANDDIVAVLSYLRSLAPVRNEVPRGEWALFGKVLMTYAFPPLRPRTTPSPAYVAAGEAPSIERGRYLSESVALCNACHTATDQASFAVVGPKAGGGLPDPSHGDDANMEFVAPNLTSHRTGVTGQLSEDEFLARMRRGRVHASSIMPWENFGTMTDVDLRSVYQYLRSLPAVDNDVGPTYREKGWSR